MTTNHIVVPTTGTNKDKFLLISEFFPKTGKNYFKEVFSDFRNAGKVAHFIRDKMIAYCDRGSNFNGYGYEDHDRFYLLSRKDAKTVIEMIENKPPKKEPPTFEQQKMAWCHRLAKLTGITIDDAIQIADEKLQYHEERIDELEDRQDEWYSTERNKLIKKLRRSNPLRRIKDKYHAWAILEASVRHNCSNYESMLEAARQLAEEGEIDKSEIKDYARRHTKYWSGVQSTFFSKEEEDDDDTE